MLVDTDVMIWFLRGNSEVAQALEALEHFSLSVVTHIELVQGMRDKAELRALRITLRDWEIPVIAIDEAVSSRAAFYVEEHFHGGGLRLADALIASTAVVNGLPLLTANTRHYRAIKELELHRF